MTHIALHFVVPPLVAVWFYRTHWRQAALIMVATMMVDVDHLLADPIYDPGRCSIGFHPLHTTPAIVLYASCVVLPLVMRSKSSGDGLHRAGRVVHLIGVGLIIHMALDWIDCMV